MKKNLKIIMAFVLGLIISGIGVYAVTQINATDITYDNTTSGLNATDAQSALDELTDKVNNSGRLVTIYSAASDTIYYYDSDNNKVDVCSTKSNGVGRCTLPVGDITLYSTIAKNPSDQSVQYSKSITVSSDTSSVILMPDGQILYWYGYNNGMQQMNSSNGWTYGGWTLSGGSWQANSIYLSVSSEVTAVGIGSTNKIEAGKVVSVVARPVKGGNYMRETTSKTNSPNTQYRSLTTGRNTLTWKGNNYLKIWASGPEKGGSQTSQCYIDAVYAQ